MPFHRVRPEDAEAVAVSTRLANEVRAVTDPEHVQAIPELRSRILQFGWDLDPAESFLYTPAGGGESPVGILEVEMPRRDNLHLVWAEILVHPEQQRRAHGSAIMNELIRLGAAPLE